MTAQPGRELATLGGGCFWCLEAVFKDLKGVESVVSGYAGGEVDNPSYEQVCAGRTGHAEVVQIGSIPRPSRTRTSYTCSSRSTIRPRNRQGADIGPQYRSIIFYHDRSRRRRRRR